MKRTRLKLLLATGLTALGLNLNPQSASAITTSGVMPANETWSGNIELTGDVTVPNNVTLTILPGTHVKCWDNYDDTAGGVNGSRIELIAAGGVIQAVGTEASKIVFTSAPLHPPAKRGDWFGVRLGLSTNGVSTLKWCVLEYSINGLSFEGGSPVVQNCSFQHNLDFGVYISSAVALTSCLVSSNGVGIGTSERLSGGISPVFLTNCVVANNRGGRVYYYNYIDNPGIAGGHVTIVNCLVTNHQGPGVIVYSQEGGGGTADIQAFGSTITGNGSGLSAGAHTYSSTAATVPTYVTAADCIITNNQAGAVGSAHTITISRCLIRNNGSGVGARYATLLDSSVESNGGGAIGTGDWGGGGAALLVSNSVVRFNQVGVRHGGPGATLINSTIAYNTAEGVWISSPTVRGCSIDHNATGLRVGSTSAIISSNRITANTSYEIQNEGSQVIFATNNFWGEPTTTELTNNVRDLTKVYDSQDNASVGQVILKPYLATDPFAVPPQIIGQPADLAVAAGTTATFTVTATSASPMTYRWRKGTTNLAGQTNSFLTFTAQVSDVATNYNVIVANSDGSTTSRWATLTVLMPPAITSHPTNLFQPAGSTAMFHVTATGSAPLSYQWQKEGVKLSNAGRVSGATSPDLTITSIQAADVGNYRVVVTNAVGAVTSLVARLDLPVPPTITTNPATQTVGVGGPATFSVTATGSTPMNYQWYLNGSLVSGATGASFTIPTTSADWLGSYQVRVWNSAGTNWSATAGLWLDALKMYAGVNVYGPAGSNCLVQYATNLTGTVTWTPLQSVTIVTNPTVIIDYNSPEQPKRFYRTVPQ
jgi:hypothetical protein